MSEDASQEPPKKHFFKLPADISTMSDEEIDIFAQGVWNLLERENKTDCQDQGKSEEN